MGLRSGSDRDRILNPRIICFTKNIFKIEILKRFEYSQRVLVNSKDFINSVERVITVSIDRKEGVKIALKKDQIQLFVNSSSSGEGKENLEAQYDSDDLTVGFNSRYLLDIASEIQDEKLVMNLHDPVSPVLIQDKSDKQSFFVIMPMKI